MPSGVVALSLFPAHLLTLPSSFPPKQECCELLYLAAIATVACTVITIFKCFLFKVLRESSILLDGEYLLPLLPPTTGIFQARALTVFKFYPSHQLAHLDCFRALDCGLANANQLRSGLLVFRSSAEHHSSLFHGLLRPQGHPLQLQCSQAHPLRRTRRSLEL